jgi:glycosyltransferase involved in cell wall biosynthesis
MKKGTRGEKTTRVSFVSCYPPGRGRLSEYAYSLLKELQDRPSISHIDIITETIDQPIVEKISDTTTAHRIWRTSNPLTLLSIPATILRLRPDIVHFNVHMAVFGQSRLANFIGLCLPFACRMMGFKTVTTLHNTIDSIDVEKTGYRNTFINRFSAFMVTKLISLTNAVTMTLRSHADSFKARYHCDNVRMIPHGTWKNDASSGDIRWTPGTILYMGHSGPYKDLSLLLDAFQILQEKRDDVNLVIAGASHPNYPGFLDKYKSINSSNKVRFTGYIPEDQLTTIFHRANVVVLPYFTCTGTSDVAHLASSFGTPIVATDLPEFRELAGEGCGLLLAPHNPRALANKIEEVIDNPTLASELKERNLEFANTRTWDKVANSFSDLYDELSYRDQNTPSTPFGNVDLTIVRGFLMACFIRLFYLFAGGLNGNPNGGT